MQLHLWGDPGSGSDQDMLPCPVHKKKPSKLPSYQMPKPNKQLHILALVLFFPIRRCHLLPAQMWAPSARHSAPPQPLPVPALWAVIRAPGVIPAVTDWPLSETNLIELKASSGGPVAHCCITARSLPSQKRSPKYGYCSGCWMKHRDTHRK